MTANIQADTQDDWLDKLLWQYLQPYADVYNENSMLSYELRTGDLKQAIRSKIQQQQTELLARVERELPEKKDEHPMEDGVPVETYGYEAEYNSAIDQVRAALKVIREEIGGSE